jgi:hypothetical protein
MPNWCESELTVSSNNIEQLKQFVQHISDTERGSEICLEKLLPIPRELLGIPAFEEKLPAKRVANLISKYGFRHWQDWSLNNWGALCQFAAEASWISENCVKYAYATKWDPAVDWIQYAAHLYPDLEFTLNYDCWEFSYYGTFRAHGMTHSNEFYEMEPEEAMVMSQNAEEDGQKESPMQDFGPETTVSQKQGDESVNDDIGDEPVFSFDMFKFD